MGYADNLGVQFQIDLGPEGGTMPLWVDEVSLTASTTDPPAHQFDPPGQPWQQSGPPAQHDGYGY
jgi:hypothetical protein